MAQKILVLDRRTSGKERGKDILYIHDTILLFSEATDELRAIWESIRPALPAGTLKRFRGNLARYFSEVNDDVREAAAIAGASGRAGTTNAEAILEVCKQGIGLVFGG